MKKGLCAIIILGMVAVLSMLYCGTNEECTSILQEPLATAVLATGAKVEKTSINGWGKLPKEAGNEQKLETLVQAAMDQLGINPDAYQLTHSKNTYHHMVNGICQTDNAKVMVIAQMLYPAQGQQNYETYLVINIEKLVENQEKIVFLKGKIANIFLNTGSSAHISTCLVGWLDGKLEQDDFTARLKSAFKAIDATVLDKLEQANFASYSGLSPAINECLVVGGKKTNVNMAVRYSPYDNRTYITIGSPLITGEY